MVTDLLQTDAVKKFGVYLLLSKNMVYAGQASDLAKRINNHIVGKDWWESVVILTTKDDSLTHSDIDYLEYVLIDKARKIGRLDCENKNKGNKPKVDKFRSVYLGQYIEEALFIMQLIGIRVFSDVKVGKNGTLISTIDTKTKLTIGKRAKAEAIEYLHEKGVEVDKKATYAVRTEGKQECWANPQSTLLTNDWNIILNDNVGMELVLLNVPADTFTSEAGKDNSLVPRADKPNLIDLRIDLETFVDKRSNQNFSKFVVKRIKY